MRSFLRWSNNHYCLFIGYSWHTEIYHLYVKGKSLNIITDEWPERFSGLLTLNKNNDVSSQCFIFSFLVRYSGFMAVLQCFSIGTAMFSLFTSKQNSSPRGPCNGPHQNGVTFTYNQTTQIFEINFDQLEIARTEKSCALMIKKNISWKKTQQY